MPRAPGRLCKLYKRVVRFLYGLKLDYERKLCYNKGVKKEREVKIMEKTYSLLVAGGVVRVLTAEEIPEIQEQIDNRDLFAEIVEVTAEPGAYVYDLDTDELLTFEEETQRCDKIVQEYVNNMDILAQFIFDTEPNIEDLVRGRLENEYFSYCLDWANEDEAFDYCVEIVLE